MFKCFKYVYLEHVLKKYYKILLKSKIKKISEKPEKAKKKKNKNKIEFRAYDSE